MNVFSFLKTNAGKLVMGLPQKVALTVGLGAAAAGVVYMTGDKSGAPEQQAPVRGYVMGNFGRNEQNASSGEETIKIAGGQSISSVKGSSAAAGYDWGADDASLAAVDKIGSGSKGVNPATRGMSGRTEGLGGNNDIVVIDRKSDSNVGGKALAAAGAAGGARAASAAQRGVMATASGGVSGNMYGGSSSRLGSGAQGSVNRSGNSLGVADAGNAYRLSGAMPEGSTLLASAKFKEVDSSFGNSRGARAGRGMQSGEGRTLRQITKRSADIAKNTNRSANEAGRAFLASSQNSGGIQLDNGSQLTEGGAISDDFEEANVSSLNNLNTTMDDLQEQELERRQDRTRLKRSLVALVFLTIPAMFAISALMKTARNGVFWAGIAAAAVGVAMALAIGLFMADAGKFMKKWGGSGLTTACMIVGPTLLALIGISYIKAVGEALSNFTSWLNDLFGGPVVGAASAISAGQGAFTQAKNSVQGIKSSNQTAADTDLTKS